MEKIEHALLKVCRSDSSHDDFMNFGVLLEVETDECQDIDAFLEALDALLHQNDENRSFADTQPLINAIGWDWIDRLLGFHRNRGSDNRDIMQKSILKMADRSGALELHILCLEHLAHFNQDDAFDFGHFSLLLDILARSLERVPKRKWSKFFRDSLKSVLDVPEVVDRALDLELWARIAHWLVDVHQRCEFDSKVQQARCLDLSSSDEGDCVFYLWTFSILAVLETDTSLARHLKPILSCAYLPHILRYNGSESELILSRVGMCWMLKNYYADIPWVLSPTWLFQRVSAWLEVCSQYNISVMSDALGVLINRLPQNSMSLKDYESREVKTVFETCIASMSQNPDPKTRFALFQIFDRLLFRFDDETRFTVLFDNLKDCPFENFKPVGLSLIKKQIQHALDEQLSRSMFLTQFMSEQLTDRILSDLKTDDFNDGACSFHSQAVNLLYYLTYKQPQLLDGMLRLKFTRDYLDPLMAIQSDSMHVSMLKFSVENLQTAWTTSE